MRTLSLLATTFVGMLMMQAANATLVTSGVGEILDTDSSQNARVFRDGIASTWAAPKAFPNSSFTGTYYYDMIPVAFAPNAIQDIYYEIIFGATNSSFSFAVAYKNSYDATDLSLNYLGDSGSSVVVGTPITFEVIVAAGDSLILAFSNVQAPPSGYSYVVNAFSDINRGENFGSEPPAPVPAPATLVLLGLGLAGLGWSRRKKA